MVDLRCEDEYFGTEEKISVPEIRTFSPLLKSVTAIPITTDICDPLVSQHEDEEDTELIGVLSST